MSSVFTGMFFTMHRTVMELQRKLLSMGGEELFSFIYVIEG
jgi:hypothetical protein